MKTTELTKTEQRVMHTQGRVGAVVDGFWGEKSIEKVKRHLRGMMPKVNPWPAQDQASLTAFYGKPGDESRLKVFKVPCVIKLKYCGGEIGKPGCEDDKVYCHEWVGDSLMRVLVEVGKVAPHVLEQYYGCYNNRPIRGGRLPSLHARGAAIDLDAAHNGNLTPWPLRATMPVEVMECFAREGWLAAGAFWGRDAMHFQATR